MFIWTDVQTFLTILVDLSIAKSVSEVMSEVSNHSGDLWTAENVSEALFQHLWPFWLIFGWLKLCPKLCPNIFEMRSDGQIYVRKCGWSSLSFLQIFDLIWQTLVIYLMSLIPTYDCKNIAKHRGNIISNIISLLSLKLGLHKPRRPDHMPWPYLSFKTT